MPATRVEPCSLTIEELASEGGELFQMHFDEIRAGKGFDHEVDPDWKQYQLLEDVELLQVHGLRADEKLVGYIVVLLVPRHLHYRFSYATVDVMFVHPQFRGAGAARDLVRAARAAARDWGAAEMLWHAAPNSAAQAMMEHTDRYQLSDYNYVEKL